MHGEPISSRLDATEILLKFILLQGVQENISYPVIMQTGNRGFVSNSHGDLSDGTNVSDAGVIFTEVIQKRIQEQKMLSA